LRERAFIPTGDRFRVRDDLRQGVEFRHEDLTEQMPAGPFHLVLCRNLAFTYFDEPLQGAVVSQIVERLVGGGYLVIGAHETLPECRPALVKHAHQACFWRKIAGDPVADPEGREDETPVSPEPL
jgi:chemotaxis protein methyltransferase CheR